MPALGETLEESLRATVAVVRGDDDVAGIQKLQHERHRRHPSARDHTGGATLELRERLGELCARRIAAARVIVLARPVESLERERRREMDRRHDGAVLVIRGDGGAHRARRRREMVVAHDRLFSRMRPSASGSVRNASCP